MAIWYKGGTESRHSDALIKKDMQDSENASKKIGHNAVQEMIESLYYWKINAARYIKTLQKLHCAPSHFLLNERGGTCAPACNTIN